MPRNPDRLCPCHGEPMFRTTEGRHVCYHKQRANWARNYKTYKATPNGRRAHLAAAERSNARRIRIGDRYLGLAETATLARQIQSHIDRKLHAFKSRFQKRAEVESVAARGVSAEADDPAH